MASSREESTAQQEKDELPWDERARKRQQEFLLLFGREENRFREKLTTLCYLFHKCNECQKKGGLIANSAELKRLKRWIGLVMYGAPHCAPSEQNDFMGYSTKEMRSINVIFKQMMNCQTREQVVVSPVFVLIQGSENNEVTDVLIFRVASHKRNLGAIGGHRFVDLIGRSYKNWNDFLSHNQLPKSRYCYPKNGVYTAGADGNVEIDYGETPAASVSRLILKGTDLVGTIVAVGAGVGLFFPPAVIPSIVVGGVAASYATVRSSVRLADRGNHGQSIADSRAWLEWISIAGSILGFASAGGALAAKLLVAEGKVISELAIGILTGVRCTSATVNSIGFCNSALSIHRNGQMDPFQCFQMAAALMLVSASLDASACIKAVSYAVKTLVAPKLLTAIKTALQKIGNMTGVSHLLRTLEDYIIEKFSYGREFMSVLRIIVDIFNCRTLSDAGRLFQEVQNLLDLLLKAKLSKKELSSGVYLKTSLPKEQEQASVDDAMSEIVMDKNFIPGLVSTLESVEETFHFPRDHRVWGKNGELSQEEYILIGQSFFSLSENTPGKCTHKDGDNTAKVYFEKFGLVIISSSIEEQTVTVRKILKSDQPFGGSN